MSALSFKQPCKESSFAPLLFSYTLRSAGDIELPWSRTNLAWWVPLSSPAALLRYVRSACRALAFTVTHHLAQYWGLSFAQLYRAIFHPGNQSPTVYLSDLRNPLFLTKVYLHFTSTAIADLLFVSSLADTRPHTHSTQVYRLYVVWQDRRCVVLPPLLAVASYLSIGASRLEDNVRPFSVPLATSAITWLAQAAVSI